MRAPRYGRKSDEHGEVTHSLAVAILLGAIETVLAQWRRRPTRKYASQLEDAYIMLVTGELAQLAKISAPEC